MTTTKTQPKRKQIDYWQVVNVDKENNEIIMLEGFLFDTSYREHWDKLRA